MMPEKTKKNIILELNKEEDLSPTDLEERLSKSRRTIRRHLDELNDMGAVASHKVDMKYGGKKNGYILIDENVEIKPKWEKYTTDLSILGTSLILVFLSFILFRSEYIFLGFMPLFTSYLSLIFYRAYKIGDNKDVIID